ncbi:MAG: DNA polymerase III subunit delta' [Desulfovibrio sp.]|uniref:DNA polymerase III subunit delta' n=1 Tax=Desulfovibrio sp. 7SRBS1 TaxID=3378064 RepID=UPI003B3E7BC5
MADSGFPDTGPFARVRGYLDRLRTVPPRSLLLEGGSSRERFEAALHWARLLNCTGENKPCMACAPCVQIGSDAFRDLFVLDGREGTIKIDDVREIRRVMGEPPRGSGSRVIVLAEAQELTIEAANSLLKNMEEPLPGNVFVLTAPQRERLLPTLVSRSFVLTLPWPESGHQDTADTGKSGADGDEEADLAAWSREFYNFCRTGRGWLSISSARGMVTKPRAERFLTRLQGDLTAALSGKAENDPNPARDLLDQLGPSAILRLDAALNSAQEAVAYRANPALALDWLGVTINGWLGIKAR